MEDLHTLGGTVSGAYGINDAGQVVGESDLGDGSSHAFLWDGSMHDLGTLGGTISAAYGINNAGQVVGYSYLPGDSSYHAFLWDDTANPKMRDLDSYWRYSEAYGINDAGQVVGRIYMESWHAFLWDAVNGMRDLAMITGLPGASVATGINNNGDIICNSTVDGITHAYLIPACAYQQRLDSIDYTSDHGVLTDETETYAGTGTVYDSTVWESGRAEVYPISQTKNTPLVADVTVFVNDPGRTFKLVGDGPAIEGLNCLDFESGSYSPSASPQTITVTAKAPLPNMIYHIMGEEVNWSIEWTDAGGGTVPLEPVCVECFVTYDIPYSGSPNGLIDSEYNQNLDFAPTVIRLDLLTGNGVYGMIARKDIVQGIANQICSEWQKHPSKFTGIVLVEDFPYWRCLDPVNPYPTPTRILDCYSGKILCAAGSLILGIPRQYIKTNDAQDECFAYASTDEMIDPYCLSDCTGPEMPNAWCTLSPCPDYPAVTPHPEHSCFGQPKMLNIPPDGPYYYTWGLYFDSDSPGENYIKIMSDNSAWYYVTVVFPLPYPIQGSVQVQPPDYLDKLGRYLVMKAANPTREQYWMKDYNKIPAKPLPPSPP
jgi:probable HAF family extracellular repeat protein